MSLKIRRGVDVFPTCSVCISKIPDAYLLSLDTISDFLFSHGCCGVVHIEKSADCIFVDFKTERQARDAVLLCNRSSFLGQTINVVLGRSGFSPFSPEPAHSIPSLLNSSSPFDDDQFENNLKFPPTPVYNDRSDENGKNVENNRLVYLNPNYERNQQYINQKKSYPTETEYHQSSTQPDRRHVVDLADDQVYNNKDHDQYDSSQYNRFGDRDDRSRRDQNQKRNKRDNNIPNLMEINTSNQKERRRNKNRRADLRDRLNSLKKNSRSRSRSRSKKASRQKRHSSSRSENRKLDQNGSSAENRNSSSTSSPIDPFSIYGKLIGQRLARMNEKQQAYAKMKIEEALFAAEYGNLTNSTATATPNPTMINTGAMVAPSIDHAMAASASEILAAYSASAAHW